MARFVVTLLIFLLSLASSTLQDIGQQSSPDLILSTEKYSPVPLRIHTFKLLPLGATA